MIKKLLTLLVLILLAIDVFSQSSQKSSIIPTVQASHSQNIDFFDTWNDQHLLLTASKHEVILWDTQTGLQLRSITSPHTIVGVTFANKGNEIAVLMYDYGKDASLRFYDARDGKEKDSLAYYTNNTYNGIYWKSLDLLVRNREGTQLLLKDNSEIYLVDAAKKTNISHFTTKTFEVECAFTAQPDELLIVDRSSVNPIVLVNFKGEPKQTIPPFKEQIRSAAGNGSLFYLLTEKGKINVLNSSLTIIESIDTHTDIGKYSDKKLIISDDGKKIVSNISDEFIIYDVEQKKWINKKMQIYQKVIATTVDASQIALLYKEVSIIQPLNGQKVFDKQASLSSFENMCFSPSGNVLMLGSSSYNYASSYGINLFSGAQLKEGFAIKQYITDSLAICIDQEYSSTGQSNWQAQIKNVYTGKGQFSYQKDGFTLLDAKTSTDQKYLALLAPDQTTLLILSGKNYSTVKTIALKGKSTRSVAFSPNSRFILVKGEEAIRVYDLSLNKWISGTDGEGGYGFTHIAFTPDSKSIIYYYNNIDQKSVKALESTYMLKQLDLTTGNAIKLFDLDYPVGAISIHPTADLYAIAYLDGNVELRKLTNHQPISKQKLHSSFATELIFHPKYKWLLSSGWDKQLAITDFETGKQVAKGIHLFNDGKSGMGFFTPNNYYMIPASNISGVHFTEDFNAYSFKQFDCRFNRPDKVLQALQSPDTALINSYKKAYDKRIKKLGIDTSLFTSNYSVPEADIANRNLIEFEHKTAQLVLNIKANDKSVSLDRFNIWVNEVPVYGLKGINLKSARRNTIDTTITIDLSAGNNKIETSVINANGIESYRLPLNVNYVPVTKPNSKMYFVGVGINNFEQQGHNLQWSVKDIRDLANKLKEKYTTNIEIDTLFDEKVTAENVLALKTRLKKSSVDDKVIVAYSGHGLLSKNYDYFLSTYKVDFEKPEQNGLAYDSFEDLVDHIPARKKLMLIDACHSGEVDKEELQKMNQTEAQLATSGVQASAEGTKTDETGKGGKVKNISKGSKLGMKNSFELMQDLFANIGKGTGATIISAAGGMQYALEKSSLKNGVFTYSIIEYMNEVKTSGIKKLKDRVNQRVVELTAGMQQPTSRSENNVIDWSVW